MLKKLICVILALCLLMSGALAQSVKLNVAALFGGNKEIEVEFSDAYFLRDAREYNHALMRLSLALAVSGMGKNTRYGEDGDFGRESHAFTACAALGFADARAHNYTVSLNDMSDKVAFTLARRALPDGSELVVALIRSGNYGCEWASNFRVGDGDTHEGFTKSAAGVLNCIDEYTAEFCAGARVKIWLTGFSRGAAVANLAAAALNERARTERAPIASEDIFAYTFATPATVMESAAQAGAHTNIFNIVNAADVVPEMPLALWGYSRCGTTLVFARADAPLSAEALKRVNAMFTYLTGRALNTSEYTLLRARIDDMLATMSQSVPDAHDYASAWQLLFSNLSGLTNYRLNSAYFTRAELDELCAPYGDVSWTRLAARLHNALPRGGWTGNTLLAILKHFGEAGARAIDEASVLADVIPSGSDTEYEYMLAYLALSMMNAEAIAQAQGGNKYAYLTRSLSLASVFLSLTDVFGGHMPDLYMAYLLSADEAELFK